MVIEFVPAAVVGIGAVLLASQSAFFISAAAYLPYIFVLFAFVFVATALLGSGADAALSKDFPWQFRLAAACRTPVLMYIAKFGLTPDWIPKAQMNVCMEI